MPRKTPARKGEHVRFDMSTGEFLCDHCGQRYAMALPAPLDLMAGAMKSFGKSHERCKLGPARVMVKLFDAIRAYLLRQPGAMAEDDWISSNDTGISSKTIWTFMRGSVYYNADVPHDPDDFGRCHRLLKRFPRWRKRLPEIVKVHPKWAGLVEHWDELTALYEEEVPSGKAPRLYRKMVEIRDGKA